LQVVEEYSFGVPQVINPITVRAALRYRSADQGLIDGLFGEDVYDVPIIDMATASTEINSRPLGTTTRMPGFEALGLLGALGTLGAIMLLKRRSL